jgi:carbon monoxide dehydrogenase subunit G
VHIENTFAVDAPADRVFAVLLDVNRMLGCVPGAELSEILEDGSFRGRVRVRVGPVSVAYQATGNVVFRDDSARTAVLEAEGHEAGGSGSARAVITVTVGERGAGAEVLMVTELTLAGRGAQTDPGMVEEVSRSLLGQMAACIGARLAEPRLPLPTPTLSTVPDEPPTPVDRALSLARDRPLALASAGGAAAAALVVAVLLRMRGRRW